METSFDTANSFHQNTFQWEKRLQLEPLFFFLYHLISCQPQVPLAEYLPSQ